MPQIILRLDEEKNGTSIDFEDVDPLLAGEVLLSTGLGFSMDVGLPWESMIICYIMQQSKLPNKEILEIMEHEMRKHRSQKEQ